MNLPSSSRYTAFVGKLNKCDYFSTNTTRKSRYNIGAFVKTINVKSISNIKSEKTDVEEYFKHTYLK